MEHTMVSSQYLQIALDLASRIAKEEFSEGSKIYGRSVMASEYNVSPETIRRALKLLHDMKVVEIKPQSGATVLSIDNAKRYIQQFEDDTDVQSLKMQLKDMLYQSIELHRNIEKTAAALIKSQNTFIAAGQPLPNYEITVSCKSPVIGKSLGELNFWQTTGATVIAVRRGKKVILSPGPYFEFYNGDVIILVGITKAIEAANRLITTEEEAADYDQI